MNRLLLVFVAMSAFGCERVLMLGDDSRENRLLPCDATPCGLDCPNGFLRDATGCERCECAAATLCTLACEHGFARDGAGNQLCACAAAPDAGAPDAGTAPPDAGSLDAGSGADAGCADTTDCTLACSSGFARDIQGCEVCACAAAPRDGGCGMTFCQMPCANGYKRSAEGCELCVCSPPPVTPCVVPSCALTCPAGFNTDSSGCRLCECSN